MIYLTKQNFTREKSRHEVAKMLRGSVEVLFWNLVFMCNGIQSRICTDLLKFQSKVRDPIHIIILMMSIFHFSFILFMYLHLLINNKNQIIICNISEKTFSDYVYLGKYTQTYAPFNVWFHSWSENN